MPWTKNDYPASMKNLPDEVRAKAIEIANALLEETNMNDGIAIATAISRAKDWAANRGKETESKSKNSRSTDVKKHGEDRYVVPHGENEWAVKKEGAERVEKFLTTKKKRCNRQEKKHMNQMPPLLYKKRRVKCNNAFLIIRIKRQRN